MMSNDLPLVLTSTNLSYAWGTLFSKTIETPNKELSSVIVNLVDFKNGIANENTHVRKALDDCLAARKKQPVQTVSNTIFPESFWEIYKHDRKEFFEKYISIIPRIKALDCQRNRRGVYFERLVNYGCDFADGNQLEHIISAYNSNPKLRRSMFQASIFDPNRDHTRSPRIGFPCLQHLQFVPNNRDRTLSINAFYATQQIFEKAYGNYLGICRLGRFMAHEMNLSLDRVTFYIGVAKLDSIPKGVRGAEEISTLREKLKKALYLSDQ